MSVSVFQLRVLRFFKTFFLAAYARGPFSWLMSGSHEQSYIPHVLAYALCIGQFTSEQHCFGRNWFPFQTSNSSTAILLENATKIKTQTIGDIHDEIAKPVIKIAPENKEVPTVPGTISNKS